MNVSLYQAAAAMQANARWHEVISGNLASSTIPGYKKQDLSFEAVQAGVIPQAASSHQSAYYLPKASLATNFSPGEMRRTGVNTDVAIEGRGFFEVQLPNGTSGFTRDGEFSINSAGQLVTKQGYLVLGDGGPIQLDPSSGAPLTVSPTGEISQGTARKGRLKVVEFSDPRLLTPVDGAYFIAQTPGIQASDVSNPVLRQGFLEGSNASSVTEMANLIGVMRSYEANQRIVQVQDERMGRTITELGNPN